MTNTGSEMWPNKWLQATPQSTARFEVRSVAFGHSGALEPRRLTLSAFFDMDLRQTIDTKLFPLLEAVAADSIRDAALPRFDKRNPQQQAAICAESMNQGVSVVDRLLTIQQRE